MLLAADLAANTSASSVSNATIERESCARRIADDRETPDVGNVSGFDEERGTELRRPVGRQ